MCGIVGIASLNRPHEIRRETVGRMLGSIRHRGPDEFGMYLYADDESSVALGSARLSIIDLAGGQQPLSNEDGTMWVVFNGEIYNYVELRVELEALGHRFSTQSDTEVLLHLFEQYGREFLSRLNGQFAFAIWSEAERSLFLARDRMGIRPLHYVVKNGIVYFASEMKALFSSGEVNAKLDPVALGQVFTYWSTLSPRTAFEGVRSLPPGHSMQLRAGRDPVIEPYWSLEFPEGESPVTKALDEYEEQLFELLVDATRIRLRADVPVGAYLSGGIDSSVIASLIRSFTETPLKTFSIGFEDQDFDESPYQEMMSAHLGTEHSLTRCSYRDIGEAFPNVIWHTETPILRTSPVPMYLLAQLVHSERFKVVLTGEGADEMLAGYNIFKEAKIRRWWAREPDSVQRAALLRKLYPYIGSLGRSGDAYLTRFFGAGLTDVDAPDYSHQIRWRNTSRTQRLFSADMKRAAGVIPATFLEGESLPPGFTGWSPLARAQYLEIKIFMSEYLLSSQGDRMAMAHSVEGRFPFLDHRVVEFANRLPPRVKLRALNEKYLLKRLGRRVVPEEVWRRPKRPYRAPIHRSFFPDRQPLPWVEQAMSSSRVAEAGYFNPVAIARLLEKQERSDSLSETDDMALAGVLSTQLLHQRFVADFDPPPGLTDRDKVKVVARGMAAMPITSMSDLS